MFKRFYCDFKLTKENYDIKCSFRPQCRSFLLAKSIYAFSFLRFIYYTTKKHIKKSS